MPATSVVARDAHVRPHGRRRDIVGAGIGLVIELQACFRHDRHRVTVDCRRHRPAPLPTRSPSSKQEPRMVTMTVALRLASGSLGSRPLSRRVRCEHPSMVLDAAGLLPHLPDAALAALLTVTEAVRAEPIGEWAPAQPRHPRRLRPPSWPLVRSWRSLAAW
jgi:hypothetical protein